MSRFKPEHEHGTLFIIKELPATNIGDCEHNSPPTTPSCQSYRLANELTPLANVAGATTSGYVIKKKKGQQPTIRLSVKWREGKDREKDSGHDEVKPNEIPWKHVLA